MAYYQCSGVTKKGKPCQNWAMDLYPGGIYCWQHNPLHATARTLFRRTFGNNLVRAIPPTYCGPLPGSSRR